VAFRHRRLAISAVLLTCLSLLLGTAVPAAAESSIVVDIASSPILVTRGNAVSYVVSVRNTGGNAVNHVTLESDTPPGYTYVHTLTNKGTCNGAPASEPFCDLGKFIPGTQAVAVLIFNVAPTAQLRTFDFEVVVHAGEGTNDQTHSAHTDTFRDTAPTTVLAMNQNFTTHYIVPQGDDITTGGLSGATALSASNPQGTRAIVPSTPMGVPASVRETGGPNSNCPPAFAGRCFGQSSTVSVGNGAVLSPYLRVEVRFDKSVVPYWLTDHKLVIIHWFDPVPSAGFEQITRICSDSTPKAWELPCRLHAQVKPDGDWFVTVFMRSNGTIKGKG
jgi:uncharacterized repeat protein (TIGR01451 family)